VFPTDTYARLDASAAVLVFMDQQGHKRRITVFARLLHVNRIAIRFDSFYELLGKPVTLKTRHTALTTSRNSAKLPARRFIGLSTIGNADYASQRNFLSAAAATARMFSPGSGRD
jgi:hypothetical protein